jgi:ribonuclease HII
MLPHDYELSYWKSKNRIAGIDEVGRGSLAGPVVACAVVLPFDYIDDIGLADSKLLSVKKRNILFEQLIQIAESYSIAIIDNHEIDKINILQATMKAMNNAIDTLSFEPDVLLIDGNYFKGSKIKHHTIIKGDNKSLSISAASIIAKVTRDDLMQKYAKIYPYWHFESNKGYGSQKHLQSINNYNICNIHRISYLKSIISRSTLF